MLQYGNTNFVHESTQIIMVDFKNDLNQEQYKVVTEGNGPCLVLAGAGSGKTRAITYRVAYLLEQGVDPKNILLVTFTNKAAREMIERVRTLTGGEIRLPWSGTFHHVGYRLLRKYATLLGYKNNFTILDSQDSVGMIKVCLKQEGIDRKEKRFPSPKVLQNIISYARNAQTSIEDVLDLKYPNFLGIADVLVRIAENYEKKKKEANSMDFDDLLVNTLLLLSKSESVRKKLSEQFKYVLVDEYQDTNKIQASIIRLLAEHHKNILVVGDDAQSIYSFRAADIQNILSFEKEYPDVQVFKLETNYRSTPDILNIANDVIGNNTSQYEKELKSILDNFTKPELHSFSDNQEEAIFIANRIEELLDEDVPAKEIAVLFRAAFHSQALEVELVKRGVNYEYRGGVRFFERAHIKDVLAYLRVFNNLEDTVAWGRVLTMQVGIGPVAVERIIIGIRNLDNVEELKNIGSSLSSKAQIGWNDFLQIWQNMEQSFDSLQSDSGQAAQDKKSKTPSALIQAVINSKYKDYLENEYPDYRERLQDLEQLAVFADKESELDKFLAEATLQEGYSAKQANDLDDEKIILSTIHQAKGLEWQGVFIINVSAGQFPSDRAMREENGVEEERRLFYVAITRAKKHLYFTYPLSGGFGSYMAGPSIFLEEIDQGLLSNDSISNSSIFSDLSDDVTYEVIDDAPVTGFLKSLDDL